MTKIRAVFKKFLSVVQICLVLFSAIFWHLSNEKMGIMRWLVYENERYDNFFMRNKIIWTLVIILILSIAAAVKIHRKPDKKYILFVMVNFIVILFAFKFNSEKIICYFVINVIFIIVLIVQLIKLIFYWK